MCKVESDMINAMNIYKRIGSILLILWGITALTTEAGNLYRYRNQEGNLVIDYAVPPRYVAGGYEILSESGRVIEVVEPQQEREEWGIEQQNQAKQAAAHEQEGLMLLRTYNDVGELKSAKSRRLAQLNREIEIIQSNLDKNKITLATSRIQAANYQFGGRSVPKSLLKNLDGQIFQQQDAEQMLLVRQQEYQGTKDRYTRYLDHFRTLKGLASREKTPSLLQTTDPANAQLGGVESHSEQTD